MIDNYNRFLILFSVIKVRNRLNCFFSKYVDIAGDVDTVTE